MTLYSFGIRISKMRLFIFPFFDKNQNFNSFKYYFFDICFLPNLSVYSNYKFLQLRKTKFAINASGNSVNNFEIVKSPIGEFNSNPLLISSSTAYGLPDTSFTICEAYFTTLWWLTKYVLLSNQTSLSSSTSSEEVRVGKGVWNIWILNVEIC